MKITLWRSAPTTQMCETTKNENVSVNWTYTITRYSPLYAYDVRCVRRRRMENCDLWKGTCACGTLCATNCSDVATIITNERNIAGVCVCFGFRDEQMDELWDVDSRSCICVCGLMESNIFYSTFCQWLRRLGQRTFGQWTFSRILLIELHICDVLIIYIPSCHPSTEAIVKSSQREHVSFYGWRYISIFLASLTACQLAKWRRRYDERRHIAFCL